MIGLDANVVIRYLVQDDPEQGAAASRLMDDLTAQDPGFISLVAAVEICWVLQRGYRVPREDVAAVLAQLMHTPELEFEQPGVLRAALARASAGADIGDAVIAESGRRAGCSRTLTFDQRAAKHAGMSPLSH